MELLSHVSFSKIFGVAINPSRGLQSRDRCRVVSGGIALLVAHFYRLCRLWSRSSYRSQHNVEVDKQCSVEDRFWLSTIYEA